MQNMYSQRELIEQYQALGFEFLFSEQVIGYSHEYRQACYDKITESVERAIADTAERNKARGARQATGEAAHGSEKLADADAPLEDQFRARVLQKYGTLEEGWQIFDGIGDTPGELTRRDWKAVLSLLDIVVSSKEKGALRKKLDPTNRKTINFADFTSFMASDGAGERDNSDADGGTANASTLATLPADVPDVPDAYCSRPATETRIINLLLNRAPSKSPCVLAQGMYVFISVSPLINFHNA